MCCYMYVVTYPSMLKYTLPDKPQCISGPWHSPSVGC